MKGDLNMIWVEKWRQKQVVKEEIGCKEREATAKKQAGRAVRIELCAVYENRLPLPQGLGCVLTVVSVLQIFLIPCPIKTCFWVTQ